MALVIEDGSIVDGANSFVTTAEFDTYLSDRGYAAVALQEPPLIRAYDFMLGLPWCVSHDEAFTVTDGIKNAQCEIAYQINAGSNLSASPSNVKREKVDVIESEYFSPTGGSSYSILKTMPQAYSFLNGLLCASSEYILRA